VHGEIQAFEAVRLAKSMCADVEFSAEDATRTDLEFLCAVAQAVVEAGATTVNLPDTVGYCTPEEMATSDFDRVGKAAGRLRECDLSPCHCHNDLGLAVANSLAAVARRRAPGRSAPSTASASAPATPRWKRS
jgi:2-isopropylmalate synthase